MCPFEQIPTSFLASIATDEERIPRLYVSRFPPVRHFFWLRLRWLYRLAERHGSPHGSCLDFGSGGGVFLPSLASLFERVVSIDLATDEAERVVERYRLDNVRLVRADVTRTELDEAPFDTIVAADVLEHFRDLAPPTAALRRWLRPGGVLLTSLPTESGLYVGLRRVFGVEKPEDHHHTGGEVERFLEASGFEPIERWRLPLRWAPLFLVSAWRLPVSET